LGIAGFGLVMPNYYTAGASVVILAVYFVPRYIQQKSKSKV
jgi:2-phosphoglycerate kinase